MSKNHKSTPEKPPEVSTGNRAAAIPMREIRSFPVQEFRMEAAEDGKKYFVGLAACYDSRSEILADKSGRFREIIRPGAFTRAIAEKQDVKHLINHDANFLLGRTKSGTTTLWEDSAGLHFKTLAGSRSYEKDLIETLERKDADQCSFSFNVHGETGQRWSKDAQDKSDVRELLDLDLVDVSILTKQPAYSATSAAVSSRMAFPDGVPAEIRAHFEKRNDQCACTCESCVAGNCENCTDTACDDSNCEGEIGNHARTELNSADLALLKTEWSLKIPPGERRTYDVEIRAAATADDALEMLLYGDIGESWYSEGITANGIKNKIAAAGPHSKIRLRINSFGGDAFEGVCIGNYLKSTGKPIEVCVDGLAASAASIIAMCGDTIKMAPNALMMVHNASTGVYGYASEMRKVADVLDTISGAVAQTYVTRTGQNKTKIKELMDAETWMDAKTCVKDGFATEVSEPGDEKRELESPMESRWLATYRNVPEQFRRDLEAEKRAADAAIAEADQAEEEERDRVRVRTAVAIAAAL